MLKTIALGLALLASIVVGAAGAEPPPAGGVISGPWNVESLQGGVGLEEPLAPHTSPGRPDAGWTLYAWISPAFVPPTQQLIAGVGEPTGSSRYLFTDDGRVGVWLGQGEKPLLSHATLRPTGWTFVAASEQRGVVHLYVDSREVASARAPAAVAAGGSLWIAPVAQPWPTAPHFAGTVAGLTLLGHTLAIGELREVQSETRPTALTRYQSASPHWPLQTRQMGGQVTPQPPSTLPKSEAPFSKPVATPPGPRVPLEASGDGTWTVGNWSLASATKLPQASGAELSSPGYVQGSQWLDAVVPGTVLTTLVARGVYPDPAYGLNNMAIPESLNQHAWWYRSTFRVPADLQGRQLSLVLHGVNYVAEVWVNGKRVGSQRGAFIRGRYDVTADLRTGQLNTVAIRVSPPPNPGVPHEESLASSPGPNGGTLALDGPTFIASEGWDWIPAIRDRDTGIWQPVTLQATGRVRIGDTRVITRLPDVDQDPHRADVDIDVPLVNSGTSAVRGELAVSFGDVHVTRVVDVAPGTSTVPLRAADLAALRLQHARLWWPNGYGDPHLYDLRVAFTVDGAASDVQQLHFGIRQLSYGLSLFDQEGRLQRVLITPALNTDASCRLVEVSYRKILKTPDGWAYSLAPCAAHSAAVRFLPDSDPLHDLVIRVNGVRIAIKGGSWGTDDFLKRISKARLRPYFILTQKAHLDAIRNWTGENTEPAFYDLADEYGILVLNDFWQSTQDYNMEPMDDALFTRNAADVIRRYRNHPSIALWFGRNEGVPQPALNASLDDTIATLDGTRLYMPSSNDIDLSPSGPYNYRPPQDYFDQLAKGFAVEIGTLSFPTLTTFKHMMPAADQWPVSDDWAYHDWHQHGNGGAEGFMTAMNDNLGAPAGLEDFARKAQLMNYEAYRAIFEGFNAGLWTRNSGRLLWMTQPAWPSLTWQIYSHDYAANAAYYGVKDASEPVHVQLDLPDYRTVVVNNTRSPLDGLEVEARAFDLQGKVLESATARLDAAAGSVTPADLAWSVQKLLSDNAVAFVQLRLLDRDGHVVSRNFYWLAAQPKSLRALASLPRARLELTALRQANGDLLVKVHNGSSGVVLQSKLSVVTAGGERLLPVYFSDNYVDLAPGEERSIVISDAGSGVLRRAARITLHGWNAAPESVAITR